jgi:hypothetical protein
MLKGDAIRKPERLVGPNARISAAGRTPAAWKEIAGARIGTAVSHTNTACKSR